MSSILQNITYKQRA